ncbi:MAG TPA: DMT family transporter [Candidatus Sulfomarinibacteraceae bacterium]|nr:DMT family transporter [Candidatus Sulfomarinibacteraceae bacterium]
MSTTAVSAAGRDRLMVLAAAVLFSTGGAAVKASTLGGWQVACLRSAIAALAIAALVPAARRAWNWRIWLVGSAYASTMILYVLANKLTTAANAIFLQSTAPLYILLLGPWLLGERIRLRQLALMAALAAGMALFFVGRQPALATATDPLLGNILGTASGLSWAACIMGLRWLGRGADDVGATSAAVCCGNLLAAAAALPMALPIAGATPADWAIIAFLGLFQIGVAYAFLVRGVRRVPAFEVSLLLLAEPVLNPVWAWLVHGEQPSGWALLGGAVIIAATAAQALSRPGDDRS